MKYIDLLKLQNEPEEPSMFRNIVGSTICFLSYGFGWIFLTTSKFLNIVLLTPYTFFYSLGNKAKVWKDHKVNFFEL